METESTLPKLTAHYGADMSKTPLGGGTNTLFPPSRVGTTLQVIPARHSVSFSGEGAGPLEHGPVRVKSTEPVRRPSTNRWG